MCVLVVNTKIEPRFEGHTWIVVLHEFVQLCSALKYVGSPFVTKI
jgi:hypothetical protein